MSHFIIKCTKCKKLMGQCRCPSKDKMTKWSICDGCKGSKEEQPTEPAEETKGVNMSYTIKRIKNGYTLTHNYHRSVQPVCDVVFFPDLKSVFEKIDELEAKEKVRNIKGD